MSDSLNDNDERDSSNKSTKLQQVRTFIIASIVLAALLWSVLQIIDVLKSSIGTWTIGASDPKQPPIVVISPFFTGLIILGIPLLGVLWLVREWTWAADAKDRRTAVSRAQNAAALDVKKVYDSLQADKAMVEARMQSLCDQEAQLAHDRQHIREDVEREWQRDKQADFDREYGRYLGYMERQRAARAKYESDRKIRAHRLLQLDEFVLTLYPDFALRTDPVGQKGAELVAAAFRKHIAKKLPDAGLLRNSQDKDVRAKLGNLGPDFPAAPPPITPPILIPIPDDLLKRFGLQQNYGYIVP